MAVHEEFADDLVLYALDALEPGERKAIERHLRECAACGSELERLREDFALLALSASDPEPPPHCRERLISAVAKEPRELQIQARKPAGWLNALEWFAAAAAIIIIIVLARQNSHLQGRLATLQSQSTAKEQQLLQANQLLAALTSANAEHFTLLANQTVPQPQGKAIYDPSSGTLLFLASNMPAIPAHKTYELWLIPSNGGAPIPAGIFKPNAQGGATIVKPPLPTRIEAKTFAITVEPEAGSSAPTSSPIMIGTRG